jgi:hypothetical protein
LSLKELCRRLQAPGVPTRRGHARWRAGTIAGLLNNPAYCGRAAYGKTRPRPRPPRLRPLRGQPEVPRRPCVVSRQGAQPVAIAVPALVSEELFAAAAEQLAENRRRQRGRLGSPRALLQGLVVCRQCGYAVYRVRRRHVLADGREKCYGYYRCAGRDLATAAGAKACRGQPVPREGLEAAVWADVCRVLRDPGQVEAEYQRCLPGVATAGECADGHSLSRATAQVQRALGRLIDAYSDGLLEKEEFEPRLRAAKDRLARLQEEARAQADLESQKEELRLVIGKLQEFADRIRDGLAEADAATRQEIVRALVKRVEVDVDKVTIVYRVGPVPFVEAPKGGVLQDCRRGSVYPFHQTSTRGPWSAGGAVWSARALPARNPRGPSTFESRLLGSPDLRVTTLRRDSSRAHRTRPAPRRSVVRALPDAGRGDAIRRARRWSRSRAPWDCRTSRLVAGPAIKRPDSLACPHLCWQVRPGWRMVVGIRGFVGPKGRGLWSAF